MINAIVNSGLPSVADTPSVSPPTPKASTTAKQPSATQSGTVDSTQIADAVSKLNDYVQNVQRNLSFSVDKDSGETVIKVYDAQTKEVIRQIPPDETLKLAASIDQQLSHLLVKEKA